MEWLDEKGFRLMMIELGVLAVATVAAITTDDLWQSKRTPQDNTGKRG